MDFLHCALLKRGDAEPDEEQPVHPIGGSCHRRTGGGGQVKLYEKMIWTVMRRLIYLQIENKIRLGQGPGGDHNEEDGP